MLVLVFIWILLLVFIDVDSIHTVSIRCFAVFIPFFFPQWQASDGGKGKMSLETKIQDGVP